MRRVQPIQRRFRNQLRAFGSLPIPRNWFLRRVLYLLRRAHCLLTCQGEVIQQTINVPVTLTTIRAVDTLASKTLIFNEGANSATIFENGVIIRVLLPGQNFILPLSGRFKLQAKSAASTTALRVLTYRRCLCGDSAPPYDINSVPAVEELTVITDRDFPNDAVWFLDGEWSGQRQGIVLYGLFSGNRYIEISTSPTYEFANRVIVIDAGFGLASPGTATSDLMFTVNGMTFTGTIRKQPAFRIQQISPGHFTQLYYIRFQIQRIAPDLV